LRSNNDNESQLTQKSNLEGGKGRFKGSYFNTLVALQILGSLIQIAALCVLGIIRMEMDLAGNALFVAFTIVTLVTINCGSIVLCFRRKKYVCLFTLFELAYMVLYAA